MIKKLSDSVINKIAAGEVVERPASAVKELVENSLDAGSTSVTVSVIDGGKALIRISDNGCGMPEEEALLAIERHTTSKIEREYDLDTIKTFGFRGEALPSIAAVSLFTITTCKDEMEGATVIEIEGGKIKGTGKKGFTKGTTVEVRNLFFNTPARRKFLKTTPTEQGHIDDCITKLALSKENVEFIYQANNKEIFRILKSDSLTDKIEKIFEKAMKESLIKIESPGTISVKGFISRPSYLRATRNWQYVFVNGRSVRDKGIYHAINRGYGETLKSGKHPALFLFVEIDPALVDVNIHPSKQEVRFSDSGKVVSAVIHAIRDALGGERKVKTVKLSGESIYPERKDKFNLFESYSFDSDEKLSEFIGKRGGENDTKEEYTVRNTQINIENNFRYSSLDVIGQIRNSYIIAQSQDGIYFIDQHAAHERILFEKIKENFLIRKSESQNLLIPLLCDVTLKEKNIWESNREDFEKLGFFAEDFGDGSLRITAVPAVLGSRNPDDFLKNCIERIDARGEGKDNGFIINSMFQSLACHSAIRANHRLEIEEMDNLLKEMDKTIFSTYCPHGRNSVFKLDTLQIEKFFDRR